ncbi:CRISPR-associated endonuclease Cas2 [Heliophilum fasciatum]|uniref:CRISPR-associated endoribonuclease Cas2 n=1 Tax=Heliophilum fasciatum TaxID=35700 RepID=A0A4V2SWB1_9FIRM|nr:CRISPR-associated endonuclease Cas2 [Heliophilum fasciatum]MCW2279017.1 CRISPR-associated protein Cas2 [Heliophilum fasciatum]TCP61746.1 CRISPR-associated Cas2 family protein [Heliophilum fasciatum]
MKTLVIYDIEVDKVRTKVLNACKDYGLQHIQYSAFFGELNTNRREELRQRLRRILGTTVGKIYLFPICDKDLRLASQVINRPELLMDGAGNEENG